MGPWRRRLAEPVSPYGYSKSGNDLEVIHSASRAEKVKGGYGFYGHRHFGTLSPVWDWLNTYGMDAAIPTTENCKYGYLVRDTAGVLDCEETWDTLGMRATQSHDTILQGALVRTAMPGVEDRVLQERMPSYWHFSAAEPMIANIYIGIAERALL